MMSLNNYITVDFGDWHQLNLAIKEATQSFDGVSDNVISFYFFKQTV